MLFIVGAFVEVSGVKVFGNLLVLEGPPGKGLVVMEIGTSEALSINLALRGERFWRPLSHDLMLHIVRVANLKPIKVEIYDMKDGAYLARIYLEKPTFLWFKQRVVLDSRPSDAVAFALRAGIPVYVSDHLFKTPEEMIDPPEVPSGGIEG